MKLNDWFGENAFIPLIANQITCALRIMTLQIPSCGGMMRRIPRLLLMKACLIFSAAWITAIGQNSEPASSSQNHPVMATRLYTGADGQSHIDQVPIKFNSGPAAKSAALKMSDALRCSRCAGDVRVLAQR